MPDIALIIQASAASAWFYLPLAVVLGALHALEPGHAKSMMAAYIISIHGSVSQAVTLAISAAVGHTIVVWMLAILALLFGEKHIVEQAEPWLLLLSGILLILLAVQVFRSIGRARHEHSHAHDHDHEHLPHHHTVGTGQIIWFGFTAGLLPCPAAIAVLLICIHLGAFALGVAMVAAFSAGLALTLVLIGVVVAWGSRKATASWPQFDRLAAKVPYVSAGLIMVAGLIMTAAGLNSLGLLNQRK